MERTGAQQGGCPMGAGVAAGDWDLETALDPGAIQAAAVQQQPGGEQVGPLEGPQQGSPHRFHDHAFLHPGLGGGLAEQGLGLLGLQGPVLQPVQEGGQPCLGTSQL